MIAIDLSKQQALDAVLKAIQQINFIGNLDRAVNRAMFPLFRSKRNDFRLFTRNCESIVNLFFFNINLI